MKCPRVDEKWCQRWVLIVEMGLSLKKSKVRYTTGILQWRRGAFELALSKALARDS